MGNAKIDFDWLIKYQGTCEPLSFFESKTFVPLSPLTRALRSLVESCPATNGVSCSFASELPTLLAVLRDLADNRQIQSTLLITPDTRNLTGSSDRLGRREESPLELPAFLPRPASENSQDTPAFPKNLPTLLPTCFTSKASCMNTTNSCSSHGTCVKAVANAKCFQCKCHRTVVQINPDGSKKYWDWGGKACEKKDVSVPFFLFASFGVAMMALVVGGIGLLYGMGAQELPSVLGAGVAGPRAQK